MRKIQLQNNVYLLKITKKINQGGFSDIYECQILNEDYSIFRDNLVVKKVKHFNDLKQNHRINREMRYMEQLDHKNILKPIYCDYNEGFFVMDKYPMNLKNYILKNDFKKEHIIQIFYEVLSGVKYYLSEGIHHRDLKPENILVDSDGNVKITDFGLSAKADNSETLQLTRNSEYGGTSFYNAPEQLSKGGLRTADIRSKIYSLGTILYVMLTKDFDGYFDLDTLQPTVRHLISKATSRNPEKRYQEIDIFENQLNSVFKSTDSQNLIELQNEKNYRKIK